MARSPAPTTALKAPGSSSSRMTACLVAGATYPGQLRLIDSLEDCLIGARLLERERTVVGGWGTGIDAALAARTLLVPPTWAAIATGVDAHVAATHSRVHPSIARVATTGDATAGRAHTRIDMAELPRWTVHVGATGRRRRR